MNRNQSELSGNREPEQKETGLGLYLLKFLAVVFILFLAAVIIYRGFEGIDDEPGPRIGDLDDVVRPEYIPDDYGVVSKVYDGDTVLLEDGRKIRYLGIDTPETAKPFLGVMENDPYAEEAKQLNEEWVLGREVGLIYGTKRRDHYERTLAFVVVDGTCVNAELVRHGLARLFMLGDYFKYKDWFHKAEKSARKKRWGIWSGE